MNFKIQLYRPLIYDFMNTHLVNFYLTWNRKLKYIRYFLNVD